MVLICATASAGGLGRRARDGLGEHVDHDPAVDHFAVLAVGRRRPRRELAGLEHLLERLDARLDVPLRHLVEGVQVRSEVHVARGDPRAVLLRVHHPAQEILGRLHVLAIGEHAVRHRHQRVVALTVGALGIEAVLDHLAHLGQVALGGDHDAVGVVGARDLAGQESLVVVRVQPPDAVFDARFLVEPLHVLHRLRGLAAIQRDLLAVLVHDRHAVGPQERVEPGVVVGEAVAHGHAERMALGLELDAGLQELVPGVGEALDPGLVEPVLPVVHQLADVSVGHRLPLALVDGQALDLVVPAALLLAHLLGDVGHVYEGVAVEPLLLSPCQVRAILVLDHRDQLGHRAAPRGLDLVLDLDAGGLLVGRRHHVLEVHVEVLHVGAFARERDGDRLGLGVAGNPWARGDASGPGGGKLQEATTGGPRRWEVCHAFPPWE